MKKIHNPLTIIGLFAGIAEVAGTIVLPLVSESLQNIFIWYVMGFPVLLVALFFITLNINPKVLYAPSDFTDEKNFMELLVKADAAINETISTNPGIKKELQPLDNLVENIAAKIKNDGTEDFETTLFIQENADDHIPSIYYDGQYYKLDKDVIVIGRDENANIKISALTVSRNHCTITREQDKYFLRDSNSTSGTYLDNERITPGAAYRLNNGSCIKVSNTLLKFCE